MPEIPLTIHSPSPEVLQQVDRIAANPAEQLDDLREQVATLANALSQVAHHCADLDKVLSTLLKNAVFPPAQ